MPYTVELEEGGTVQGRSVILAAGAQYRKLDLPNLSQFEGVGVYYGATKVEGQLCSNQDVIVVGGGNSAGQAALFLSGIARRVYLVVRRASLADTMSRYLISRIEACEQITLKPRTEIEALEGNGHLERVRWREAETGTSAAHDIRHLFLMTGASPNTAWLRDASRPTTNSSCARAPNSATPGLRGGLLTCWKRAARACSRWAISDRAV